MNAQMAARKEREKKEKAKMTHEATTSTKAASAGTSATVIATSIDGHHGGGRPHRAIGSCSFCGTIGDAGHPKPGCPQHYALGLPALQAKHVKQPSTMPSGTLTCKSVCSCLSESCGTLNVADMPGHSWQGACVDDVGAGIDGDTCLDILLSSVSTG